MSIKIRDSISFGIDCMFDIDGMTAKKAMRKTLERMIDPNTHVTRCRDTSISACFKAAGDYIFQGMMQYESMHPETRIVRPSS